MAAARVADGCRTGVLVARHPWWGALARCLARHVWALLLVEGIAVAAVHAGHVGGSWHFFRSGALLLTDASAAGGGLHLYHANPQLQIGPLSLLGAWPFAQLPAAAGQLLACELMNLAGLTLLATVAGMVAGGTDAQRRAILLPGLLFVPVWGELAIRFGHLDDVLALLLGVAAVRATRVSAPWTAILIALAVGCKPWAVVFVPLLFAAPRHRRGWALAGGAVVTVAPWLPFLVADPANLTAAGYRIPNAADSALRALGVDASATPPWDRPAQVILGIVVAAVAVRRGRAELVLLAGLSARLLLDPGTYAYYTAGLVAAAVVADVVTGAGRARRAPWFTFGAFTFVYLPEYVHLGPLADPAAAGKMRATFLIGVLVVILATRRLAPGRHEPTEAAKEPALACPSAQAG